MQTSSASSTGDDHLLIDAPHQAISFVVPAVAEVTLQDVPPLTLCEGVVRCVMFRGESPSSNRHVFLVNVTSSSRRPISELSLALTTKESDVTLMAGELTSRRLDAFSPTSAQMTASMVFVLDDTTRGSVRVQYSLAYVVGADDDATSGGTFVLPLRLQYGNQPPHDSH